MFNLYADRPFRLHFMEGSSHLVLRFHEKGLSTVGSAIPIGSAKIPFSSFLPSDLIFG